ncbi:c-type cytochrome [Thiomicrorhabdus heinhorstiae]|nr:cytochrome c [Thiomicrorhabdus heinhorstiae]
MKTPMKSVLKASLVSVTLITAASAQSVQAGDVQQGKQKAALCFSCHGEQGRAILPQYPNLSGQSAKYLSIALKGYKNGTRLDPVMAPMAKILSEDDIANISAYFATFQ